jgi:hypothetical protein
MHQPAAADRTITSGAATLGFSPRDDGSGFERSVFVEDSWRRDPWLRAYRRATAAGDGHDEDDYAGDGGDGAAIDVQHDGEANSSAEISQQCAQSHTMVMDGKCAKSAEGRRADSHAHRSLSAAKGQGMYRLSYIGCLEIVNQEFHHALPNSSDPTIPRIPLILHRSKEPSAPCAAPAPGGAGRCKSLPGRRQGGCRGSAGAAWAAHQRSRRQQTAAAAGHGQPWNSRHQLWRVRK